MNDVHLDVQPTGCGWSLDISGEQLHSLLFRSAADAAAQAHSLARGLATAGHDVRVALHDRRNQLVGTTRYFAQDNFAAPPAAVSIAR